MYAIYERILRSQSGDKGALLELVQQFYPLINKHARTVNCEDAFYDLQTQFIDIVKTMNLRNLKNTEDSYLLSYLTSCMKNHSIYLSKKQNPSRQAIPLSSFGNEDDDNQSTYILDKLLSSTDEYLEIEYEFLHSILTKREAEVVIYFYLSGYQTKDIAEWYHVSMPAISQVKTTAIKKLAKYISSQ